MADISEEAYLAHYGTPRKSGRYPWGSGGAVLEGSTRNMALLDHIENCKRQGLSDKEIYEGLGMSSTEYRAQRSIAKAERQNDRIVEANYLVNDKQMSKTAAAAQMGIPESTLRTLLAPGAADRAGIQMRTANMLKDEVERKQWVDVGAGVEGHLGISKEKLTSSLAILKQEGYMVHGVNIPQLGTDKETRGKVLALPGTTQKDAFLNIDNIQQTDHFSIDGGRKYGKVHDPIVIDSKRVKIRYAEDGGALADGVIHVREGVPDVSLGKSRYSQVRIMVDGTHYIKGMAIYKDDLPPGIDIEFNTNKDKSTPKMDVLKPLKVDKETGKVDKDLPFGAVVRQIVVDHDTPNEHVVSAMNIVREEGEWQNWSKAISTQVLSKQSPTLARSQLRLTREQRKKEYDEIKKLTNPEVRKKLLKEWSDNADSAAVHLEAAALSKHQAWHVILPTPSLKPNEVFAPNYNDGDVVSLIRYPHGGTFEIPELVVNNGNRGARKIIGIDAPDAIGIHPLVAERLSGADFDGDTVIVIPNKSGKLKSTPALEDLKGFDPRTKYRKYEGMPLIKDMKNPGAQTQKLMGDVSNLITDMTIRGAPPDHIARAVKHSMVVIDAEKHELNYKKSALDNGIKALKDEYQSVPDSTGRGASTLISRAKAKVPITERKERPVSEGGPIDPKTGKKMYVDTDKTRVGRDGVRVPKTKKYKRLEITDDAHTLSSGTNIEKIYADHSNELKDMANKARLDMINTPRSKRSPSAATTYASEVASLKSKLFTAELNAPRERQAQIIAGAATKAKRQANPGLDKASVKKIEYQNLAVARKRTGAGKERVKVTPKEWEAIQAGAISSSQLDKILANADMDQIKKLATPRAAKVMTGAKAARAARLMASGNYTRQEIATALGVSLGTLDETLYGPKGGV